MRSVMDVAPPMASGSRIQELGDRLVVSFRRRRSWGTCAFLVFWLTCWTVGGLAAASQLPGASPGEAAFLLFWLCGWVFGEFFVIGAIVWEAFGRQSVTLTPDSAAVRWEARRFARTTRYDTAAVRNVTAERVPHDEDERPRKDFGLRLSFTNDDPLHVGEGLDERVAEYLASFLEAHIRPRSWWDDETVEPPRAGRSGATTLSAGRFERAEPDPGKVWRVAFVAVAAVVLSGTLIVAMFGDRDEAATAAPQARVVTPPHQEDSPDARTYAAAMTAYALASSRTFMAARPACARHVTWTQWTCHVRARASDGPFAGQLLTYRCRSFETRGVLCGPVNPPGAIPVAPPPP